MIANTHSLKSPGGKFSRRRGATLVLVSALAGLSQAGAQTVDTSEWVCEYCPFESGYRGDYNVGVSSVSEDSAYFGDASGYDEKGGYANVSARGSMANEAYRMQWQLQDLGLDSRAAEISGAWRGSFDYAIAYRETPRRQFDTTSTVFGAADGGLTLPAAWVRAPVTAGLTGLGTSLVPLNIESDRSRLDIGGRYRPATDWKITADYRRQERDGNQVLGGAYFTSAALLPAQFDYVTDEVDLGIRYANDRSVLALAWYVSDFENGQSGFAWEHPFTTVTGAESAALAQPPDNRFQQLMLSGAHSFQAFNTHASFSVATGTIEQDEPFLDYTTNAALVTSALPRTKLAGDIDTSRLALAVSSRPMRQTRVEFSFRRDERDNKTAQDLWNRVIAESFVSGEMELNVPYSYERSLLKASASYRLFDDIDVSAGYERRESDYDFQEVAEQSEDTGWGRVRWRARPTLLVDLRGGTSKRDIDRYDEAFAVTLGQNPLLRKYNLAYRFRQFGELTMTYSPAELPVSVGLNAKYADDSYTKSRLGITSGDDLRLGADLNWTIANDASLYFNVGYEGLSSTLHGAEALGDRDWRANTEDDFLTFGSGLVVRKLADKFDLQLDYVRTDGASEIRVARIGAPADAFPDLTTRFDQLRMRLTYRRSDRLDVDLGLLYQRFHAADWALEGVGPATIPTVLTLGAQPYSPEVYVVGIGFRYRVEPPASTLDSSVASEL